MGACGGLWWFVVVYGGLKVVCGGLWWFVVVCWWFVVVCDKGVRGSHSKCSRKT